MRLGQLALLIIMASPALAQTRGYVSRPCGFDLGDFDGIPGEAGDCEVCDGSTTDVDGNAVTDELWYVDCDSGTDTGSCGSGAACRTVQYALDNIGAPDANQIQAICIKGTCDSATERTFDLTESGAAGTYTVTAGSAGWESSEWDFEFPRYPFVISGWDADNDGEYPPYDTDDTAVFDGNTSTDRQLMLDNVGDENRVEIAHLTARDYQQDCGGGSMVVPQSDGGADHLYFHDWVGVDIGKGCCDDGIVNIPFAAWDSDEVTYHAFVNMGFTSMGGGYLYRGAATEATGASNIMWKNIGLVADTSPGCLAGVTKHWDFYNYVQWLDSSVYGPGPMVVAQCNQDWVIRNNEFFDWTRNNAISVQAAEGGTCNSPGRPVTNLVIDRNEFRCSSADCHGAFNAAIQMAGSGGSTVNEYVGAVTITNNFFSVTGGTMGRGILIDHPTAGTGTTGDSITIIGNTFDGGFSEAGISVWDFESTGTRVPTDWVVRNNLFSSGTTVDYTETTLADYSSTGNRYESGMSVDQVSGSTCTPTYASEGTGDYHLSINDTCALDDVSDPSGDFTLCTGCISTDYDGDPRSQGAGWDAGADEYLEAGMLSGGTATGVTLP